ncbi:nitroreductase family deazaflavin-dependent oxidoreductase [Actinacidiphila alni]|uniref:Deazaflavin-dependent oxidoreductase, nitroreductase family n=1 Tax=Actinacidiphila alni TaxID=380248 RepID=A0A1I2BTM1_9ACTN|nr:nitroreductase family deazaflavin-dependent oxidoreductase [Actinacidiphila alni]SFE59476.1 deazaflavin-dependent oxidoreductase, nitroreductase family [Actinacidiphila alni]
MSEFDDMNARVIAEFRANAGKVGGNFEGAPMVLLHTIGARTGAERVNPLMYLPDGDRYLIFASKGGADEHPAWYRNIVAHPDIEVEIGDERFAVHAEELKGAERDEKYAKQATLYPGFAEYEKKTSRVIPVIALTRR